MLTNEKIAELQTLAKLIAGKSVSKETILSIYEERLLELNDPEEYERKKIEESAQFHAGVKKALDSFEQ